MYLNESWERLTVPRHRRKDSDTFPSEISQDVTYKSPKRPFLRRRRKLVTVNATQQRERQHAVQPPAEVQASVLQTQAEVQANRTAIHELTAHVSALAKTIEKALTPTASTPVPPQANPVSTVQPPKSATRGKCKPCLARGTASCNHCFRCGQEGHQAVGCLSKPKSAGNVMGEPESPASVTSHDSMAPTNCPSLLKH